MAKGLLAAGLALGRAAAVARVPLAVPRLRSILASGAALRLQFPAEDLGFVYASPGAATAPDANSGAGPVLGGSVEPSAPASGTGAHAATEGVGANPTLGLGGRGGRATDPQRGAPYVPTTAPGARLPHCELWLHTSAGVPRRWVRPSGHHALLLVRSAGLGSV